MCRGVLPLLSLALISAPLDINKRAPERLDHPGQVEPACIQRDIRVGQAKLLIHNDRDRHDHHVRNSFCKIQRWHPSPWISVIRFIHSISLLCEIWNIFFIDCHDMLGKPCGQKKQEFQRGYIISPVCKCIEFSEFFSKFFMFV